MTFSDGFYSAYMTGTDGEGYALLVFKDGKIVGADPLGVIFDGTYTPREDNSGWDGQVHVKAPAGGTLIQGVNSGSTGINYTVPITLPKDFSQQPFIHINTPLGPVNVRLSKIRDLGCL